MNRDFIELPEEEDPGPREAPRAFYPAGRLSEIAPGQCRSIWVKTRKVALFNIAGRLYACRDRCTHMGADLSTGKVNGTAVVCGWHGWTFDLETGACMNKEWAAVEVYRVRVHGDAVEVEVPSE